MGQPETHLIYLHGFNSSPQSFKAQAMLKAMSQSGIRSQLTVADIPAKPVDAMSYLDDLASSLLSTTRIAVAGSSLGGFYSTWLAEKYDLRAVLINPAVRPHERLHEYLGENENYHTGEKWLFTHSDIEALEAMTFEHITRPERYRVLLQTGDETLDYRQAEAYYAGADMRIEQGGDHAFQGFTGHIEDILSFCRIKD